MNTSRSLDGFLLPDAPSASRPGPGRPVLGQAPTPAQRRAEETTRVAREATDAEAEKRHAKVAKLKEARLARAAEMALAPAKPAKAAKPARKKA